MTKQELIEKIEELEELRDDMYESLNDYEVDPEDYADDFAQALLDEHGYIEIGSNEFHPADLLSNGFPSMYENDLQKYAENAFDEDKMSSAMYSELSIEVEDLENEIKEYQKQLENMK